MSLKKIKDPDITKTVPWEFDPLERRNDGVILTRLIQSLTGSYVIAVKARWGSGKSVFIKRLTNHLENEGVPVISVDAWRNDYMVDPMLAFLAAIKNRLDAEKDASKEAGVLMSDLAKHGVKIIAPVTSMLTNVFLPGAAEVIKESAEALEKIGGHLLDWEAEQKNSEDEFRKGLADARDFLTKNKARDSIKPIVVAIDELDRCRPDFSIKVLERIKHYFDVDGIIFIVATDGQNLPNSVASIYGEKIDGEVYLRKFFDYEYQLQDPSPEKFIEVLKDQFDFGLILSAEKIEIDELKSNYVNINGDQYEGMVSKFYRSMDALEVLMAFPVICQLFKLSLRDQAQAFTVVNAHLRTVPVDMVVFPQALVFSICLRYYKYDHYEKIRDGEKNLHEVLNEIRQSELRVPYDQFAKTSTGIDVLLFANAEGYVDAREYADELRRSDDKPSAEMLSGRNRIIARIAHYKHKRLSDYLKRSITLSDAFA